MDAREELRLRLKAADYLCRASATRDPREQLHLMSEAAGLLGPEAAASSGVDSGQTRDGAERRMLVRS
jgi:hypothetical protein